MSSKSNSNGITATVSNTASGAYSYAQRSLDQVVRPESRQKAYDHTAEFARARPIIFTFLASQLIFSFIPLLTFAIFALSTVAFAFFAAIIFSLFWIGVALLVLVPALLVTFSIAVLVWAWAVGSFIIARWLYYHSPVGVQGDLQVETGGRRFTVYKEGEDVDGSVEKVN